MFLPSFHVMFPSLRRLGSGLILLVGCGVGAAHSTAADLGPASLNVASWARMSAPDFGCMLEKSLGHRERRFNCELKHYQNHGDPCKNTDAYYEGPTFPATLARRVHRLADSVELDWEHGELRMVTVALKGEFTDAQVRHAFKLPPEGQLPSNLMQIAIEHDNPDQTDLLLIGFDHIGGADVECDNKTAAAARQRDDGGV